MWSWLMAHICKRIIFPGVFSHFFQILIFGVNSGAKEQKMAWNDNYVCCTPYLSNHTSHDHVFCYTSWKWWHLQRFFSFFLILVFLIVRGREGEGGGNRAENGPKWEKILSHSVSRELYLIWLCFLEHMCKMMISPAIFSLFSKVWFFGFFIVHQWMAKGNSEVCSTFTCVWFFNTKIRNLFHIPHFWKDIFTMWDYVAPPLLCVEACIFDCTPHMLKPACIMSS